MPGTPIPPGALSAPDLTGPVSFLDWPTSVGPPGRRKRTRPYRHVHLEVDLEPELVRDPRVLLFRPIEAFLREREVVEAQDLLRLTAGLLHAFSAQGLSRVDHWEVDPGGWLPLPEPRHDRRIEPVGHLLAALRSDAWRRIASAKGFALRLSGSGSLRADATVRRLHRERKHSISIDLWGTVRPTDVRALFDAIRARLPVLRASVTSFTPG